MTQLSWNFLKQKNDLINMEQRKYLEFGGRRIILSPCILGISFESDTDFKNCKENW